MSGHMLTILDVVLRELLLFAACGMLIVGLDDLILDLLWLANAVQGKWRAASLANLPQSGSRNFALFIPVWHESNVIGPMLTSMIERWDSDNYIIYVGCYPNDAETLEAVERIGAAHPTRVRIAVNSKDGPTTKADNLNNMWACLKADRLRRGPMADAIILHDAEDVVHRDELKLYDALLESYDMIQIPVVPSVDRRSRWIGGHYADEFAEAHCKEMPMRNWLGTAIPSAGVGVAFSYTLVEQLEAQSADGLPFDPGSVTEDYEIGIRASALGARSIFARVKGSDGSLIASRGLFPTTIRTSVTQKARWMLGIALAGWDRLADVGHASNPSWINRIAENWMRWRDHRSIVAALFILTGYAAFAAAGVRLILSGGAMPLTPTSGPDLRWLLSVTLFLLIWRAVFRTAFTFATYGWREAWRAPFRMVVSNIIAIMANSRALFRYIKLWRGGALQWDKTTHYYPTEEGEQLALQAGGTPH